MSVAAHLGIDLRDYDRRIRTFIPDYDEMLDVAAAAVPPAARTIVDLGTGTGALAARCLQRAPAARVVGVDADGDILRAAARRLGSRATFVTGSFLRVPLPSCDAVVGSFSLHHVATRGARLTLYRRIRRALRRGGHLITVDCHPASDRRLAAAQHDAWEQHLRRAYSGRRARGFLDAWSHEDHYVPLHDEVALLARAGFDAEIVWRKGAFAVLRSAPARQ